LGIVRLQHVGVVVRDLDAACERYEEIFGLKARDFRTDQGSGMQRDARILLGNDCWLHLVENRDPNSRVHKFLQTRGEGLEHIALQTTTIEQDVSRIEAAAVPIDEGQIFDADDGLEAFVLSEHLPGHTIEVIQPHATSWS
jgi:catechol 2,3-dioxygenase-like lactoylglutathione lyase family enzyme